MLTRWLRISSPRPRASAPAATAITPPLDDISSPAPALGSVAPASDGRPCEADAGKRTCLVQRRVSAGAGSDEGDEERSRLTAAATRQGLRHCNARRRQRQNRRLHDRDAQRSRLDSSRESKRSTRTHAVVACCAAGFFDTQHARCVPQQRCLPGILARDTNISPSKQAGAAWVPTAISPARARSPGVNPRAPECLPHDCSPHQHAHTCHPRDPALAPKTFLRKMTRTTYAASRGDLPPCPITHPLTLSVASGTTMPADRPCARSQ